MDKLFKDIKIKNISLFELYRFHILYRNNILINNF